MLKAHKQMRSLRANLLYMDEIVKTFNYNLKSIRHYINVGFGRGDRLTDVPLTCDKQPRKMIKKRNKSG